MLARTISTFSSDIGYSDSSAAARPLPVSRQSLIRKILPAFMLTCLALVSPPVALALDVFARSLAEIGRADDEDLEALRPGLVAPPRAGRDPHRVPFLELDDLVVDLHPPAPAHDHVHLLLLPVGVAVRKAIAGRDALVAQARLLEFERLGRQAELEIRRSVEVGSDVLQILLEVPERERHAAILWTLVQGPSGSDRARPADARALAEVVERGIERRVEVLRVKGSDQFVALELCAHGILQLGEHKRRPGRVQLFVEVREHVGGCRVDVGDRLGRDDDPARAWIRA